MNYLIPWFKSALSVYAKASGLREGELRQARGINDFLIEAADSDWGPKEFACHFLVQCCRGDDAADLAVCIIAVHFLDSTVMKRPDTEQARHQRAKDCLAVANHPGNFDQCMRWANSWY